MSFIRIKVIPNSYGKLYPYSYLCKNVYDKKTKKKKQVVVKYLGKLKDIGVINKKDIVFDKCKRCSATQNLVIDHIKPLSKGGMNVLENIQVLCRICNLKKGQKSTRFNSAQKKIHYWL